MKAWFGVAVLVGAFVSGSAEADGNTLLQQCQQAVRAMDDPAAQQSDVLGIGRCVGMVEGVRNTMQIYMSALPDNFKVCFPKRGINNGQAMRIVDKFLHDNPEILEQNDTFLTMLAFKTAYPCK